MNLLLTIAALFTISHGPNPQLTPGYTSTDSLGQICERGYSQRYRLYQSDLEAYIALRKMAFERYHIPYSERGAYELDDLVPLCLGGRQMVDNLWPQPWKQARLKDDEEARYCRAVCRGEMTLKDAQAHFQHWGR